MIQEKIVDHAPQVRCYRCGSVAVSSLCHHCARPMCGEHSPSAFRQDRQLVSEVSGRARDSAKPANREFAWLKHSDLRRAAVYHCEDHAHVVRNMQTLIAAGAGVAVLGVIVALFSVLPGLVLLLAGGGLAAWGLVQHRREADLDPASRPLPLFPHVDSVEVIERLTGTVRLAGGRYTSDADQHVQGEIKIEMSANDGQHWLRQYRKKYGQHGHDPVSFAAGFAMIAGQAGLSFADNQDIVLGSGTGLSFSGGSAASHPLFETVTGRPPGDWKPVVRYEVHEHRAPREIPLWIVPSVVPSSDRRTLEIDLHWNKLGIGEQKLNLTGWELIELELPKEWGTVEGYKPSGPTIGSGGQGRRIVRWEQLPPADHSDVPHQPVRERKSRSLILQFEKPILPDPSDRAPGTSAQKAGHLLITGTLKARFGGTLSGINGIELYLPGGAPLVPLGADGRPAKIGQPDVRTRTEVTVKFSIGLEDIRYQGEWVVPDDSNAWNQKAEADRAGQAGGDGEEIRFRNKTDEFPVVADYRTVTELTNLISKEGYYVKSVVEQLPFIDDGRPNVINHVWDIAGRWYEGVFPIDFDVNLRGEDLGDNGTGRSIGRTIAQVTVKGTYVHEAELTQRTLIEERWGKLHGHVTDLLKNLSVTERARALTRGVTGGWSDVSAQDVEAENDGPFAPGTVIVDAEVIETDWAADQGGDQDRADAAADLRRRRMALVDGLIAGRISEKTYQEIVARIDAELRELGEQP
jgi:hypothetical protein